MGTTYTLCCCFTPAGRHLFTLCLQLSPALECQYLSEGKFICFWCLGFCGCHSGQFLIACLWRPGVLWSCVPQDCNNRRDSSWLSRGSSWLPFMALRRLQTETHSQSLCERDLFAYPASWVWRAGFWFGTYLEIYRGALKKQRLGDIVFAFFLFLNTAR